MNAFERMSSDELQYPSDLGAVINHEQEAVLMCGLAVKKAERIQSVNELQDAISTAEKGHVINCARTFYRNNNKQSGIISKTHKSRNENSSIQVSDINHPDSLKDDIDRDIQQRLEMKYINAVDFMRTANDIESYEIAVSRFKELGDYKNTLNYIKECENHIWRLYGSATIYNKKDVIQKPTSAGSDENDANIQQKQEIKYRNAIDIKKSAYGIGGYEVAINAFNSLGNYKDSKEQILECQNEIEKIREEKQRIENWQSDVEEKTRKKRKIAKK